jgi:hypothetical protein
MTRTSVLKIVNPILGVLLFNQVMTGLLHDMLPREAYEVLHEGGGIVFAIVALLHVILNWNWIKANFFRKPPTIKT